LLKTRNKKARNGRPKIMENAKERKFEVLKKRVLVDREVKKGGVVLSRGQRREDKQNFIQLSAGKTERSGWAGRRRRLRANRREQSRKKIRGTRFMTGAEGAQLEKMLLSQKQGYLEGDEGKGRLKKGKNSLRLGKETKRGSKPKMQLKLLCT